MNTTGQLNLRNPKPQNCELNMATTGIQHGSRLYYHIQYSIQDFTHSFICSNLFPFQYSSTIHMSKRPYKCLKGGITNVTKLLVQLNNLSIWILKKCTTYAQQANHYVSSLYISEYIIPLCIIDCLTSNFPK